MKMRAIQILVVIILLALTVYGQESSATLKPAAAESSTIPTVGHCELIKNPKLYYGKVIRVKATLEYFFGIGEQVLDINCNNDHHAILVSFAEQKPGEIAEKLGPLFSYEPKDNIEVVVVGKFYGPHSPKSKSNYGHMGWSKYLFEIVSVEEVSRTKAKKD